MGSLELHGSLHETCDMMGWKTLTTLQNEVLKFASQGGNFVFLVPEEGGGKIGAIALHIFNTYKKSSADRFFACILASEKELDKIMQQINTFGRVCGLECMKVIPFDKVLNGFKRIEMKDCCLNCKDCYYVASPSIREKDLFLMKILQELPKKDAQLVLIFAPRHNLILLKSVLTCFGEKVFAAESDATDNGLDDLVKLKYTLRKQGSGRLILVCPGNGEGFEIPSADVGINYTLPTAKGYEVRRSRIGSVHGMMISFVEDNQRELSVITQRSLTRLSVETTVFEKVYVGRIFEEKEAELDDKDEFDPSEFAVWDEFDMEMVNRKHHKMNVDSTC